MENIFNSKQLQNPIENQFVSSSAFFHSILHSRSFSAISFFANGRAFGIRAAFTHPHSAQEDT
jgi:hypothetical protein